MVMDVEPVTFNDVRMSCSLYHYWNLQHSNDNGRNAIIVAYSVYMEPSMCVRHPVMSGELRGFHFVLVFIVLNHLSILYESISPTAVELTMAHRYLNIGNETKIT